VDYGAWKQRSIAGVKDRYITIIYWKNREIEESKIIKMIKMDRKSLPSEPSLVIHLGVDNEPVSIWRVRAFARG